jgi:CSLREA domain-containing protein
VAAGAVVGMASPALAGAAIYTVDNTNDPGDGACNPSGCTLREAISYANAHPGPDDILFQTGLTGTITLGPDGALPITGATNIYGLDPDLLAVSGNHTSRIFDIDPTIAGSVVLIYGLTMVNGTVTGNGGAIRDQDASLEVVNSVLSGNTATSGSGGAIYEKGDWNSGYDTLVQFSTLDGNTAAFNGGAVDGYVSFGAIKSSTLTGNTANFGGGARAYQFSKVYDSTVAGNHAATMGGGLYAFKNFRAYNSIVADNTSASFPDVHALTVFGDFNLLENPGTTPLTGLHNITGQDPQLGPLASNGGDEKTMMPAPTSPAIDKGREDFFAFDQRKLSRPVDNPGIANGTGGDGADIGSVELQTGEFPSPASGGAAPGQVPPRSKKCKKKKHKRSASAARKKCKKKK